MFKDKTEKYVNLINTELLKYSQDYPCLQKRLFDSVNYSLLAPGKRLRPLILLASCEMAGGDIKEALPFAIALEMIHNSSLIHDDLPAMDNDELRRGNPTNHIKFDEATAILAGDVLLVRPFEIMAQNSSKPNHIEAMRIIAKCAGSEGMMGGQQIDLDSEGKQVDKDTIITLNSLKTGALFKASVEAGIVIAGGDLTLRQAGLLYAEKLGLAFQLVDDLLDNDEKADTGKTKGSDIASDKSTYLSLYGVDECKRIIGECTYFATEALKPFGDSAYYLTELVKTLENRAK